MKITKKQLRMIIESASELGDINPSRLIMLEKVKKIYKAIYGVDKYDPGEINNPLKGDMTSIISLTTNWMLNKVRSATGSKKKAILTFNPSTLYTSNARGFYVRLKFSIKELEDPDNTSTELTRFAVKQLLNLSEVILRNDELYTTDNYIKHPSNFARITVPDLMRLGEFFKNVYSLASDLSIDTSSLSYYGQSEESTQNVVRERLEKLKETFGIN